MSDDYEFRVQVMEEIKRLKEHIDRLYGLVESIERKDEAKEAMSTIWSKNA